MYKNLKIAFVTSMMVSVLLSPVFCIGDDITTGQPAGTVCYPLAWGGIVPGITVDKDIVTLYGEGIFDKDVPHLGARYYTDKDKSVTVIVTIGVDEVIEEVNVVSGIKLPPDSSSQTPFVSLRVDPNEGFGNWPRLHLGSTKEDVKANLGEPHASPDDESNTDKWVYETDYTSTDCYIYSALTLTFENNRVVSIDFYNGE